jgi:hypothetical protein
VTRQPQVGWLKDGKRLHLQDGPIDLIVEAEGSAANKRTAYAAATGRFAGLLDELCDELTLLRTAADPARCALQGIVARRMHAAVAPFATDRFITPAASRRKFSPPWFGPPRLTAPMSIMAATLLCI